MGSTSYSTSIHSTKQFRWAQAIADAQLAGLQVVENVESCCGGCVTAGELGIDDSKPYAWTPGYQEQGYLWADPNSPVHFDDDSETDDDDDDAAYSDEITYLSPVKEVYFHHNNGGAVMVVTAFTDNGFRVAWDGSDSDCVTVYMRS